MAIWLRGGRCYDVAAGRFTAGNIRIEGCRIAAIAGGGRPAGDDRTMDTAGAFLMPGFIDCHVHPCTPTEDGNPDAPWRSRLPGEIAIYAALAGCRSVEHGSFGDEETYALMAEKGTFLVPTLCVHSALMADPRASAGLLPHIRERYIATEEVHLQNAALAARLGVPLAMGTDAGTPGNHHGDNTQEIVRMVTGAGLEPAAAIAAATMGGARLLGRERELGSLEAGKLADIVALGADPLDDIAACRDVRLVVKDGEVVRDDLRR